MNIRENTTKILAMSGFIGAVGAMCYESVHYDKEMSKLINNRASIFTRPKLQKGVPIMIGAGLTLMGVGLLLEKCREKRLKLEAQLKSVNELP